MPIDPSIIGNVMAPQAVQMPDVNAMMRTQTQGMENIYQIEAARGAQAAEQAKAQEDAVVKALFPAYSYVLETGDLAGGLEIAPAQYRDVLIPHIKALEGKSLPEIRAALTGSLVTSETGRALLENRSRAATLGVQQGQLDVSRQDLVLKRQKQALDARGEGEWKWQEGVDANGNPAFAWVNPRTRQVEMANLGGGAAPAPEAAPGPTPIPAPDAVTPRAPAPGMPEVAPPAGAVQPPAGAVQPPAFRPKPKADKDITQEERRRAASVRYTDKNASRVAEIIDKNPAAFGQGADEFLLSIIPFDMGKDFLQFTQDADREQVYYRMTQIVATLLRLETGAAYTTPELVTESASFMPKYGDAAATARDKIDALQDRVTSAVGSTGRAWTPQDQAEYDAAMLALEAVKDRLYPAGGGGDAAPSVSGGATEELPEGTTKSNW
jgi:hypothetical protein